MNNFHRKGVGIQVRKVMPRLTLRVGQAKMVILRIMRPRDRREEREISVRLPE